MWTQNRLWALFLLWVCCLIAITLLGGVFADAAEIEACYRTSDAVYQDYPDAWASYHHHVPGHLGQKCWFPTDKNGHSLRKRTEPAIETAVKSPRKKNFKMGAQPQRQGTHQARQGADGPTRPSSALTPPRADDVSPVQVRTVSAVGMAYAMAPLPGTPSDEDALQEALTVHVLARSNAYVDKMRDCLTDRAARGW